jgi:dipeptide/tripeptide permease
MTSPVLMVATPPVPASTPVQWIPLLLIIPVIIFWVWMFRDMLNNKNLSDTAKSTWTVAFIILNAFAAVFYYAYEYRSKRQ